MFLELRCFSLGVNELLSQSIKFLLRACRVKVPESKLRMCAAVQTGVVDWANAFLECSLTIIHMCMYVYVCVPSLPRWMKKPRCGVPDHPHLSRRRRNKRYALTGQKWRQKHITYRCCGPLASSLVLTPMLILFFLPKFPRFTW